MPIYPGKSGFGKRYHSVTEKKKVKRLLVRAMVKKLKAAGKPINLQDINQEVLDSVRRKKQTTRVIAP